MQIPYFHPPATTMHTPSKTLDFAEIFAGASAAGARVVASEEQVGKGAVKAINRYGDEVVRVFEGRE